MYRTSVLRNVRRQRLLHDVTIELTYRCNLDCFYCYNDRAKQGTQLSLAQYRALLEDLARMQTLFLMLTGGEPMVHPHFFDIGRMTRELGFVVRVRTNGHTLDPHNVERLLHEVDPYMVEVTLHGATAEVHDRQTRVHGSFDRLLQHLRHARSAGLRCGLVTTPTAWNEHQIEAMVALGDELAAPVRFQGPVGPRDNGDTEPLSIQPRPETWLRIEALVAARRAMVTDEHRTPEVTADAGAETPATCSVGLTGVDIDPFGNVQACMHLGEPAGNLHEQSIVEIWNHSPCSGGPGSAPSMLRPGWAGSGRGSSARRCSAWRWRRTAARVVSVAVDSDPRPGGGGARRRWLPRHGTGRRRGGGAAGGGRLHGARGRRSGPGAAGATKVLHSRRHRGIPLPPAEPPARAPVSGIRAAPGNVAAHDHGGPRRTPRRSG